MSLQYLLILFCILQSNAALESVTQFRKQYMQSGVQMDPLNCSINACEALQIMTQIYLLVKSSDAQKDAGINHTSKLDKLEVGKSLDTAYGIGSMDIAKRVRQIESRLRSVEQPVWRLTPGSQIEWNHCTSGVCRCNPDTKRFTCWNTNLKSVPVMQVIPMNMVSIDLSRNLLSTLHKDTFRGLTLLRELDLSNNLLDFLPFDIFQDLDSLVQS